MSINLMDSFCLESFSYLNEKEESDIDKSISGKPVSDEIKENSKTKGVIGKIGGIGADSNAPTRNDRRYPLELWQNVEKSEYFVEGMENRTIIGEADHPQERLDYSVKEGAVVLTEYNIQNDGKVYTEFDILDTLPGRTVKTYFDAGCKLGVSSRGLGEEIMRDGEKIIDPDTYQFYCFDVVAFPAVKSARMELIESTSPKRQTVINSITNEIKNCKSIDEVKLIESITNDADMMLDEIKESIDNKLEELKDNTSKDTIEKTASSIISKIDNLGDKANKQDRELSDFLKAYLDAKKNEESKNKLENLLAQLKESNSEHYVGTWEEIKNALKADGYNIDAAYNRPPQDGERIFMYKNGTSDKDGETYSAKVTKYFNGDYEILYSSIKPDKLIENHIIKESPTKGYIGKSWDETLNKIRADGYAIDSAYTRESRDCGEHDLIMYKDNKTYKATIYKYSDGGCEVLYDTIKETTLENNKIKISGPNKNISDEDTPGVNEKDSDNLELLAELQDEVKTKDSKINELNKQLEQKTSAIKNLVANAHTQDVTLQESANKIDELTKINESISTQLLDKDKEFISLSNKYEKLQNVNKEFSKMLENLTSDYNISIDSNNKLIEKIDILRKNVKTLKNTSKSLKESTNSNSLIQHKVTSLTENINNLKHENKVLKEEKESLNVLNSKKDIQLEKLNNEHKTLQASYEKSLDKYIEAVCLKFNIKESTLRRLLGESYNISDIDKIASELLDNISKMNSLPFANVVPNRQVVYENVGLMNGNTNLTNELEDTFSFMIESKK